MIYIATVEDNQDPQDLGRVRVRVEGMHEGIPTEDLPWSRVCVLTVGQGAGQNKPLMTGVDVCIAFEGGRIEQPIVIGPVATTLDVRNLPERSYVAGDVSRQVDGAHSVETSGAQTQSGRTHLNQTFAGALRQSLGSISSVVRGKWTGTFAGRKWTMGAGGGLDEITFEGRVKRVLLEGADIGVWGVVKAALARGLELGVFGDALLRMLGGNINIDIVTPGGMTIRVRPPVPDPSGLTDLSRLDVDALGNVTLLTNAGVVRIGRVATSGVTAVPVSKSTHTHLAIGNLGLPVVVPPSVPTPDNNSVTVVVE